MSNGKRKMSVVCPKHFVTFTLDRRRPGGTAKGQTDSKITFDPHISYENYLEQFRADFKRKWNNVFKALPTGLKGFTEVGNLGTGSFGHVKLVKRTSTGAFYAAKVLSKEKLSCENQIRLIFNEKRILHSIKFPNHTNLEFSRKDENNLYLGMTLVEGGELFTYLRKLGRFSENHARFYAAQIFLALEYLHFMQLIYRDLKPENICLDLRGYVKIIDYGFTKYVPNRTLTLCGTPEYLAPEIINMQPYGASVDWWAFGVLLYELVSGKSPFSAYLHDPMVMYEKICSAEYKMCKRFSSVLKDLLKGLLQPDLSERIGVCANGNADIKRHSWFKKINWFAILNQEVPAPFIPQKKILTDGDDNAKACKKNRNEKKQNQDTFDRF